MRTRTTLALALFVWSGGGCGTPENEAEETSATCSGGADTGLSARGDESGDASEKTSYPEPDWVATGAFSDSEIAFEARLFVMASGSDAPDQTGEVVLSFAFRPSEVRVPDSGSPTGSSIVATWAVPFSQVEALFNGDLTFQPTSDGQQLIFYPRAADGQWVARNVGSLRLERRPNAQLFAELELMEVRDDILPHEGSTPVDSAIATFEGPVSLLCATSDPGGSGQSVDDPCFESAFCADFLARVGLE
jgi:hypothetical protein